MYLRVPLYKYKFCSTYGYLRISVSSAIPMGDLNKYKSGISISMQISLLYEFMKILISVIVKCFLQQNINAFVHV